VTGTSPADRPATPDRATLLAELVERFALADRRGAVARARELMAQGVGERELRDLVAAASRHVGDLWQSGHWTITQEHAATAVAEAVLTSIESPTGPVDPVGVVAVVAADGEWHALPARVAAHAFEQAGLEVRYLGSGVPASDVADSLPSSDADVLAISVTVVSNLPGAARTIAAGHAAGLPVLMGGAAVTAERATALGADGHAASVDEGAELARRWCVDGPPTELASARLGSPTARAFDRDRRRLLGEAFAATAARWPQLEDAPDQLLDQVTEDLELHLDHLATALLLDEPAAYLDLTPWLRSVHAGRKAPPELLVAQLDALRDVLGDDADEAKALLDQAAGAAPTRRSDTA
jgi:methanogenic corrinoid protein MtbC1